MVFWKKKKQVATENSDGLTPEQSEIVGNSESTIRAKKPWYRDWGEAILVAFIIAMILRTFVIQAFKIPSGSMEETLLVGDHLLVNKFIYGTKIPFTDANLMAIREPVRGDIIVFEFPGDEHLSYFKRRDFIKRVIGTPGDRVKMIDQIVYVNDEPYTIPQEIHKGSSGGYSSDVLFNFNEITIPAGNYFVLGDNRDRSLDSRFWGFVPEEKIRGLAFIKYWSWDREAFMPRFNRIGRWIE